MRRKSSGFSKRFASVATLMTTWQLSQRAWLQPRPRLQLVLLLLLLVRRRRHRPRWPRLRYPSAWMRKKCTSTRVRRQASRCPKSRCPRLACPPFRCPLLKIPFRRRFLLRGQLQRRHHHHHHHGRRRRRRRRWQSHRRRLRRRLRCRRHRLSRPPRGCPSQSPRRSMPCSKRR